MSTIGSVIGKLEEALEVSPHTGRMEEAIRECLVLIKDRTVLLLEWNEIDVQQAARTRLARIKGCEESEIEENPLTRKQVVDVIDWLYKYYDACYGIDHNSLINALDDMEA